MFHKTSLIFTTLNSPKIFPRSLLHINFFFLDLQLWALRLWFMEQKQQHVISSATHPPNCRDQTFGANPLNCWENVNQEHTCKNQNQFVNKWTCLTVRVMGGKISYSMEEKATFFLMTLRPFMRYELQIIGVHPAHGNQWGSFKFHGSRWIWPVGH